MRPMCDTCDREDQDEEYEGPCRRAHLHNPDEPCPGTVSWRATAEKFKAMWGYSEQRLDLFMERAKPLYDLLFPYYSYEGEETDG